MFIVRSKSDELPSCSSTVRAWTKLKKQPKNKTKKRRFSLIKFRFTIAYAKANIYASSSRIWPRYWKTTLLQRVQIKKVPLSHFLDDFYIREFNFCLNVKINHIEFESNVLIKTNGNVFLSEDC